MPVSLDPADKPQDVGKDNLPGVIQKLPFSCVGPITCTEIINYNLSNFVSFECYLVTPQVFTFSPLMALLYSLIDKQ